MGISSSTGLASGLDIDSIIKSMLKIEQSKTLGLKQKEALSNLRLTSYGEVSSAVSALKTATSKLSTATSFGSRVAVSSDSTLFDGTASNSAFTGRYNVRVDALAKEQNMASAVFTDTNLTSVGTGSINIKIGTGDTIAVGISSNDSTLVGIQKAINSSTAGVNASIVDDGTGPKLLLRSNKTGTANTMTITVSDNDGNNTDASGLSKFINANMTPTQPAADASINVNNMAITKSSNTITDVIEGVTLNLTAADPAKTGTLTISTDRTTPTKDINAFIDSYNKLQGTITELTRVDKETNSKGPLTADSTVRRIELSIKQMLGKTVVGADGNYNTLSSIGISTQLDGTLKLNSGKLNAAFDKDPNIVAALFARMGTPTNSNIEFVDGTKDTLNGTYGISITTAATQGSYTGAVTGVPLTITSGSNDNLTMAIQGGTSTFLLTPGTYNTGKEVADMITKKISENTEFTKKASVTYTGGAFVAQTTEFGKDATIDITGGTAAATLGFSGGTKLDGVDVAGLIEGKVATGIGQVLTDANGLKVKYTGTQTGAMGSLAYTIGIADMLNTKLDSMLDTKDGLLTSRTDGLKDTIKSLQETMVNEQRRIGKVEDMLRMKFNALEGIISKMNSTGDFLSQQMSSLNKVASGGK